MKSSPLLTRLLAVALLSSSIAQASTVFKGDLNEGGIPYYWTTTLGANDSASMVHSVGSWSWEDQTLFASGGTPVGWTHQAEWITLKLEVATMVTIRVSNKAGVSLGDPENPDSVAEPFLIPGMTIYSGLDNDLVPQSYADTFNGGEPIDSLHFFENRKDIGWAEDIHYFTHLEPNGTNVVEMTVFMPAGDYSLVVGGNANSTTRPPKQGYEVLLTTGSAIPEPGSAGLVIAGCVGLLARRRAK